MWTYGSAAVEYGSRFVHYGATGLSTRIDAHMAWSTAARAVGAPYPSDCDCGSRFMIFYDLIAILMDQVSLINRLLSSL